MPCKGLDVRSREWDEAAVLEEVEDGKTQQGCDYTDVAAPVEAVLELDAAVAIIFVGSAECLQDAELDTAGVSVL